MENYHPRRHDREIEDKNEIERVLKNGKYAIIALAKENDPYIVTLSYGYDNKNNSLYFHCALRGQKTDYLKTNSSVCATIIEDHGYQKTKCEHSYASLIIRGELNIVEDLQEKKRGLNVLLNHLEEDPEPILKRNIINEKSYDKVIILRLKINNIIGKQNYNK